VTKEQRRPTAIIADDHAEVHPLLRRILEPEFDVVENVLDGQSLLQAALFFRPDLIVVDVLMPVMGGIEAVKRLHAQLSSEPSGSAPELLSERHRSPSICSRRRAQLSTGSASSLLNPRKL
jgi:CheY-like chemotaxis protein